MGSRRLFAEGKEAYRPEARLLGRELSELLELPTLAGVRLLQRYDIDSIDDEELTPAVRAIFGDPITDRLYEAIPDESAYLWIGVEYLAGQFDQRADSAEQCLQALLHRRPRVRSARVYGFRFDDASDQLRTSAVRTIAEYLVNPVDSKEVSPFGPYQFGAEPESDAIRRLHPEIIAETADYTALRATLGLAMNNDDLALLAVYFREQEGRPPTETELRVLDTYWSDHCRHTTFSTKLPELMEVKVAHPAVSRAVDRWLALRKELDLSAAPTLMELATLYPKAIRSRGGLEDLDVSEEINAATLLLELTDENGRSQPWHLLFKNETHNHPTEIEPVGGAETCLGGAIRDPLSGRAYVYQGMRVTGSGDPRVPLRERREGKLPQRVITTQAARGFSSYGNQIGIATGQVTEYYHPGYVAKRMEIGAVIGAVPADHVNRRTPEPGDRVLLIGGRTGRDGCGGATGSSKAHDTASLAEAAPEVQKGNPPVERALQRLFRKREFSRLIRRCNDFGAGGVSVAVGEIADSLDIDLDAVPLKYTGLEATEVAISESQERMACVVAPDSVATIVRMAAEENLEATEIATVTGDGRLKMRWRGEQIVDLSRGFIATNGASRTAKVELSEPAFPFFPGAPESPSESSGPAQRDSEASLQERLFALLSSLAYCDRSGLCERFDSSIGASSRLAPFGGRLHRTPTSVMAAEIPLHAFEEVAPEPPAPNRPAPRSRTISLMSHGFDPELSARSPFHGAYFAVAEAVARLVAAGARREEVRLSLQEYFPRPGDSPEKWGLPTLSLLGALEAQATCETPAIGGKDSMSGTFEELEVPPTLVAFGVATTEDGRLVSNELKDRQSRLYLLAPQLRDDGTFEETELRNSYDLCHKLILQGEVLAAGTLATGGLLPTLTVAAFGNDCTVNLGALENSRWTEGLFGSLPGTLYVQVEEGANLPAGFALTRIGSVTETAEGESAVLTVRGERILLEEAYSRWSVPLEEVFPTHRRNHGAGHGQECPGSAGESLPDVPTRRTAAIQTKAVPLGSHGAPRVCIPVFPGTNCEFDAAQAFREARAIVTTPVIRNLTAEELDVSILELERQIRQSQIVMFPGGFSAGDEPDGSGKFIAAIFRSSRLTETIRELLEERDGLILGICNGFQALLRLGLLPGGALVTNRSGRHISDYLETEVRNTGSPWLSLVQPEERFIIPVSHGEGRYVCEPQLLSGLIDGGQIATQYVECNPNGSTAGIEGIYSSDGKVFGKMGHNERCRPRLYQNLPATGDMKIFESGVSYFR